MLSVSFIISQLINTYFLLTELKVHTVSYMPSFSIDLLSRCEGRGLSRASVIFSTTREKWVNSVLALYSLAWLSRKTWIIIQTLETKLNKQLIRMCLRFLPKLMIFKWQAMLTYAVISRWSMQFVQLRFRDPSCVMFRWRREDHTKICTICIPWSARFAFLKLQITVA